MPGFTRIPSPSSLLPQLRRAVERDAARYSVSRSWVIATILADHYNITDQEPYK